MLRGHEGRSPYPTTVFGAENAGNNAPPKAVAVD